MTIALVNNQTTSTANIYNQLALAVSNLMAPTSTGYGFAGTAISTVSNAMQITLLEWQKLYFEANQIYNHITGSPIPDDGTLPSSGSGQVLQAKHVNYIINAVNTATNPIYTYTASPRQLVPLTIQDVSNSIWDSTITSVIDIPWSDDNSAQYFFNLGGKIQSTLNFSEVFPGPIEDQWISLIVEMQTIMAAHPYDRSLYITQTPQTFSTSVTATGDHITLTYTPVSARHITVTVSFIVGTVGIGADSAIDKGLKITHTCNTYCSVGSLPAPRPTGITVTTGLNQGGQAIIPLVKTLEVDRTTINYTMHQYDESSRETITLTNTGNTATHVAALIFSKSPNGQGPVPNVYYGTGWTQTDPSRAILTLQPQASTTLTIAYVSQYLGEFNNFMHIISDCDNGNGVVAIKTQQTVAGPVFRAKMNSTSTVTVKNFHVIKNQFAIDTRSNDGISHVALDYYRMGVASLMWNGQDLSVSHPESFSVDSTVQNGPIVAFNPESFVRFAGTTVAVLTATISVNCTSVSVPGAPSQTVTTASVITINLNAPANLHIGDWISPTSLNNSVVGMSYDYINAQPYLTIGVGVEADLLDANGHLTAPLPSQIADAGYNLNVNSLGATADPEWTHGVPLFKVQAPTWVQGDPTTGFLYDYGVWFYPDGKSPSSKLVTRGYVINVPVDGNYTWKFSADILAFFSIDGQPLGDSRQAANDAEAQTGYSGTIYLTKGQHVLTVNGANIFSDATRLTGFAVTLAAKDSGQIIWSTLTPVRTVPTYVGWSEVYRIPLVSVGSGVPQTYVTGQFIAKDTGAVNGNYRWQDFFGDYTKGSASGGSMFVITDDGYGNLSIRSQYKTIIAGLPDVDQTLDQLQYITYYYDTLDFDSPGGQDFSNHAERIHNLDSGPQGDGHNCHQFLGFDTDGNVVTRLTRYPGDGGFDPIPRYLVGSLHLSNPNQGPDPEVKGLFASLLGNRALWAGLLAYGLWTGGIAYYLAWGLSAIGFPLTGSIVGQFLMDTFAGASSVVGSIFSSALDGIGSLFGFGEGEILAAFPEALPFALAAYIVVQYGGKIWHAVTDVISSIPIVGGVFNAVANVATAILQPVGNFLSNITGGLLSCFDPNALVLMADGSFKKISHVVVGDRVMGQNGKANTVIGVEMPYLGRRTMYGINGGPAFVSGEHRLLTSRGWAVFDPTDPSVEKASDERLDKITVGTEMIRVDGTKEVVSIETESRPYHYAIYNLIVDGDRTYIVEGYVTNNSGCVMTGALCDFYRDQPHDWYQLTMVKILRDQYALLDPEKLAMVDVYYKTTRSISDAIDAMTDRHTIYADIKRRLDVIASQVVVGDYETAFSSWSQMLLYASEAAGVEIALQDLFYQLAGLEIA